MIIEALAAYIFDKKFLYQVVATLTTYSSLRLLHFLIRRHRRYQLFKYYGIPGPVPNLYEGNLGPYIREPFGAKVEEENLKNYGKIYGIFIGDEPTIITTDLDVLRKVFFDDTQTFTERTKVFIESPLSAGVLFAPNHRWKAMRKVMTPAFNKYSIRGGSSSEFLETSIRLTLDYLERKHLAAKAAGLGRFELDIQGLMRSTALHFISSMAIKLPDVKVEENEKHVKSLNEFLDKANEGAITWVIRFPFLSPVLGFIANNFEYDVALALILRSLKRIIDDGLDKLSRGEYDDQANQVIDTLIRLHYEGKMTRDEVIGNAEAILMAGYDTTSTTLAYIFWALSKHPDIQEKLRQELAAHGTDSKYLEQVINETMRLYPTVISFTTRTAMKTITINGYTVPQGCRVMHNTWLLQRNPELWTEPEKFIPDRFKDGVDVHPCAFAPFGLGDRRCLGYQLAMLEMKMVLCDILLRYRVYLIKPETLELKSHGVVLTQPKENVILEVEKL